MVSVHNHCESDLVWISLSFIHHSSLPEMVLGEHIIMDAAVSSFDVESCMS